MSRYQESFTKHQESLEEEVKRNIITVRSQKEMVDALQSIGCTPTPIPQADSVTIGDTTILRDVVEREFSCGHPVSTFAFAGEVDWCWTCQSMRTIVDEGWRDADDYEARLAAGREDFLNHVSEDLGQSRMPGEDEIFTLGPEA